MEEFNTSAVRILDGLTGETEVIMYYILFILLSLGIIYANRKVGKELDRGFKIALNITSISGYVFIINIGILYICSFVILDLKITNDLIIIIGYIISYMVLVTLIIFMILYIILSAFYLRYAVNLLK